MKDNVISNTHANRGKRRMKIKDNVVYNIHEKKRNKEKKQGRCNFQHPKQQRQTENESQG